MLGLPWQASRDLTLLSSSNRIASLFYSYCPKYVLRMQSAAIFLIFWVQWIIQTKGKSLSILLKWTLCQHPRIQCLSTIWRKMLQFIRIFFPNFRLKPRLLIVITWIAQNMIREKVIKQFISHVLEYNNPQLDLNEKVPTSVANLFRIWIAVNVWNVS